jgi:hypothetical protein
MTLITYPEDNRRSGDAHTITRAVAHTYSVMCRQGSCPGGPYLTGRDSFQNTYYDDTGWWELAGLDPRLPTRCTCGTPRGCTRSPATGST